MGDMLTMNSLGDGSTLSFDFTAMGGTLDPRITFSRADATALATFVNSSGIVTNVATAQAPRFDFDPTTLVAKGLLLESPATNLCLQSNSLATTWTVASYNTPSVASPSVNDPFGGTQTWKIVPTAGFAYHAIRQNFASLGTLTYTISCFVKAAQYDKFIISDLTNGVAAATFDLTAATATPVAGGSTPTARITAYANGWYRCEMTVAFIYVGATGLSFSGYPTGATIGANGAQFNPNGTDGIYMAGAQVEISSASVPASSYIPTTTASVTRAVDTAIIAAGSNFSSWYTGGTTGTFVANWYGNTSTSTARTVIATNDVLTQHLHLQQTASALTLRLADFNAAATVTTANSLTAGALAKGAFSYNGTATSLCLNGGTVATGTLAFSAAPTWLSIGGPSTNGTSITSTTVMLKNSIRTLKYFPARLSNAQIQGLTT
jgi:hypothetical protein